MTTKGPSFPEQGQPPSNVTPMVASIPNEQLASVVKGQRGAVDKDGFSCVLYGESGSGKTTALGTLTKPLVLYTERNLKSLRRIGADYVHVSEWGQFLMLIQEIERHLQMGTFEYDAVCWDSISASEPMVIQGIAKKELAVLKDWPLIKARVRDAMLKLCEFTNSEVFPKPINIVITAGQDTRVAEGSGEILVGPDVPGQALKPILFRLVDCVFHTRVMDSIDQQSKKMESNFRWLTSTQSPFTAKDGTDVMPKIAPPSFADMQKLIEARAKS